MVSKEADNEMSEPEPWQTPKNIFTHGRHSKLRRRIIFAEFRTKVLDESFDEIEEENRQQSFPYNAIETNDVHQQRRKEPRQIRKTASEKIQNDVRKFVVPNRRCSTVFSMDDYFTAAESSSSSPSLNNSLSLSLSSESNDDDVSNMSNATAIFIADGKQKRPQKHVDAIGTALSFCPPSNEEGESLKPAMAGTAKKTQIHAHFGKQQIAAKSVSTNNETTKMFPNSTYLISPHANTGKVTGILPSTETPNTLLITENGKENGFRVALSPSKVARQNSFTGRPPPHENSIRNTKNSDKALPSYPLSRRLQGGSENVSQKPQHISTGVVARLVAEYESQPARNGVLASAKTREGSDRRKLIEEPREYLKSNNGTNNQILFDRQTMAEIENASAANNAFTWPPNLRINLRPAAAV